MYTPFLSYAKGYRFSDRERLLRGKSASVGCDTGHEELSKVGHEQAAQQPRLPYKFLTTPASVNQRSPTDDPLQLSRGFTAGRLDSLCASQNTQTRFAAVPDAPGCSDAWGIEPFVGVLLPRVFGHSQSRLTPPETPTKCEKRFGDADSAERSRSANLG